MKNSVSTASLDLRSERTLNAFFELIKWDGVNCISNLTAKEQTSFNLITHLVALLARSIDFKTVHIIIAVSKDLAGSLSSGTDTEHDTLLTRYLENLHRACKKLIAQNYAQYKQTSFYTDLLRNDIRLELSEKMHSHPLSKNDHSKKATTKPSPYGAVPPKFVGGSSVQGVSK